MKRYFAVIVPSHRSTEAALLAGYERNGKLLSNGGRDIGFALDHYEDEAARYKRELGPAILSDHATRQEAETAVAKALEQRNT